MPPPLAAVGVDVGGTKCLGVVLDAGGAVTAEHRVPTPATAEGLLSAVIDVVARLVPDGQPGSVGVGLPGLVDRDGVLQFVPNLPGITDVPVRAALEARFPGASVRVDNDANCAAWAEHIDGAATGRDHAIMITLGTGIGGGIIIDGRLFRGAHGLAGELGHMVVDPHGPPCPCGQRGCWERFASGSGLGRLGREAAHAGRVPRVLELAGGDPENVRGEHVTAAAAEGDNAAAAVMADFAWWLGLGLANLANAFDPEIFVVGGGLVEAGPVLMDPLRAAFHQLLEADEHRPDIAVVPATLGEHAGAIGAARLAAGKNLRIDRKTPAE